jgi:hypothetical protein
MAPYVLTVEGLNCKGHSICKGKGTEVENPCITTSSYDKRMKHGSRMCWCRRDLTARELKTSWDKTKWHGGISSKGKKRPKQKM